ncbi:MAG: hypothetical protein ACM3JC_11495, partial [Rudaea sp.]
MESSQLNGIAIFILTAADDFLRDLLFARQLPRRHPPDDRPAATRSDFTGSRWNQRYFPMQNREKISPRRSSAVNSPVIDETA